MSNQTCAEASKADCDGAVGMYYAPSPEGGYDGQRLCRHHGEAYGIGFREPPVGVGTGGFVLDPLELEPTPTNPTYRNAPPVAACAEAPTQDQPCWGSVAVRVPGGPLLCAGHRGGPGTYKPSVTVDQWDERLKMEIGDRSLRAHGRLPFAPNQPRLAAESYSRDPGELASLDAELKDL